MNVIIYNKKRGSGKSALCIENCVSAICLDQKVLLLVESSYEYERMKRQFNKSCSEQNLFLHWNMMDVVIFSEQQFIKRYFIGKTYDKIVIDECFKMPLDTQTYLLREVNYRMPECSVFGVGTKPDDRNFNDFIVNAHYELK